jgi:hypothetical protein
MKVEEAERSSGWGEHSTLNSDIRLQTPDFRPRLQIGAEAERVSDDGRGSLESEVFLGRPTRKYLEPEAPNQTANLDDFVALLSAVGFRAPVGGRSQLS